MTVFRTLQSQLQRQNLLLPDTWGTLLRMLVGLPLLAAVVCEAWLTSSTLEWLALALVASVLQAQFAFIGHDASHGSAMAKPFWNRLMGQVAMGVVGGLCFEEWRHRHLLHHKYCQDESRDPDMQFGTVFSLSTESVGEKTGAGRVIAPFQAYYFWPSALLFAHSLRALAFAAAARRPATYGNDLVAVAAHALAWLTLPIAFGVDPWRVTGFYLVTSSLLGLRLAAVFTVNHVGMPRAALGASHLEHQVVTSRNVSNPVSMDWFFGGLNFQIEHHLFPACPRSRLRQVRRVVRPAVVATGLAHCERPWLAAARDVTQHLSRIARQSALLRHQDKDPSAKPVPPCGVRR